MITVHGASYTELGDKLAIWMMEKSGFTKFFSPFHAIGFLNDEGEIKGVVVLNNYNESNIEAHIYVPGCMTKSNIKFIYNYVFNKLKCNRLTAMPYRSNKILLRLLNRLGFEYETVLKQFYGNSKSEDAIVYKLTKNNALRFLNAKRA